MNRTQQDQPVSAGGSMPTSGTNRPGPLGIPSLNTPSGATPDHLVLERLGINAAIETTEFVDEYPASPSAPDILAWYKRSALLGTPGMTVIGGMTGINDAGPSAFTRLSEVVPGDHLVLTAVDGALVHFDVLENTVTMQSPDFTALLSDTSQERLMLLGWDGPYQQALSTVGIQVVNGIRVPATPDGD